MILEKIPMGGVFLAEKPLPMLVASFITGIAVSFCIDVFSNSRIAGNKPVLRFFTDFFSVTAAYFAEFLCALNFNNGIIRWYHAASLFLAVFLYKKFLSEFVINAVNLVLSMALKLILEIGKCAVMILKTVVSPVFVLCSETGRAVYKKMCEHKFKKYRKVYFDLASRGFYLV